MGHQVWEMLQVSLLGQALHVNSQGSEKACSKETQPFPSSCPGIPFSQITADPWARLDPNTGQGFWAPTAQGTAQK